VGRDGLTTANPTIRGSMRTKRVGNLATFEKGYLGARMSSFNKMLGSEVSPRAIYTSGGSGSDYMPKQ